MPFKIKKHVLMPAAFAVYATFMAFIGYPHYRKSGNFTEFWLTVGACLVLAVALYFVLRLRERNRQKFKK